MPSQQLIKVYEALIYNAKKEADLWQKEQK